MADIQFLKSLQTYLSQKNIALVAVSKTMPIDSILEIYNNGQRIFGENRAQELADKYDQLPKDIEWHMIGHLQRNKVKLIAPFVHLIHSVDSLRLLKEINKQGTVNDRIINCLLQVHIADEENKFGFSSSEIQRILNDEEFSKMIHIRIVGIMGMATNTNDQNKVRQEFATLTTYFSNLKKEHFHSEKNFKEISMGMSGDYQIAIEEGTTMLRIGSLLFGKRKK